MSATTAAATAARPIRFMSSPPLDRYARSSSVALAQNQLGRLRGSCEAEWNERRTEPRRDVHRRRGRPVDPGDVRRRRVCEKDLPAGVRQADLTRVEMSREDEVE